MATFSFWKYLVSDGIGIVCFRMGRMDVVGYTTNTYGREASVGDFSECAAYSYYHPTNK